LCAGIKTMRLPAFRSPLFIAGGESIRSVS
jgi:hypothetical protein